MYFEGINNLIAAESETQLQLAKRQAFGHKKIQHLDGKKNTRN